ncbi:prenyltransferase/squalene oxidase repeat-containing protein [Streptomyces sp. NPDC002677]|uniref:prenyltransferase/squalene oxidase repeat-containing protein n=1 Tax=Streptomyces sp. NPDC002677 TaxID=3154774 RepID=UPI00332D8E75
MTVLRRSAAVLAATAVIGAATPAMTATAADGPSPSASTVLPSGLFGSTDPKYDGVWRQSLALLAQHTVGLTPATKAVDWLAGQQCADGSYAAFRAEPTVACGAKVTVDTNSTAAAVQALTAVGGHDDAVGKAVTWLKAQRNKDGGWGYSPGSPSDTNSTGVVIGALTAAGESTDEAAAGLLAKWSLHCDAAGGGGIAYQPDKNGKLAANADATAAGVLGALGKGFAATAGKAPEEGYACENSDKALTPADASRNGAAYLGEAMYDHGNHLVSALAGAKPQPDYGNTADAVVAMAAQGWTKPARKPYAWLEAHAVPWAKQSGPAAYAELIFAAHAMGADPRDFGGTNLVTALNATGPAPEAAAGHTEEKKEKKSSGTSVWWIVGTGLVAGIGIGFLFSGRRKQRQP